MKRIPRFVLAFVLVALLAIGGYWVYRSRIAPVSTASAGLTQLVAVRQGNLTTSITVAHITVIMKHALSALNR